MSRKRKAARQKRIELRTSKQNLRQLAIIDTEQKVPDSFAEPVIGESLSLITENESPTMDRFFTEKLKDSLEESKREILINKPLQDIAEFMARGEGNEVSDAIDRGFKDGVPVLDMMGAISIGIREWPKFFGRERGC
jgi:hypothetical protein